MFRVYGLGLRELRFVGVKWSMGLSQGLRAFRAYWVVVQEVKLSCYNKETLLFTMSLYSCNLLEVP